MRPRQPLIELVERTNPVELKPRSAIMIFRPANRRWSKHKITQNHRIQIKPTTTIGILPSIGVAQRTIEDMLRKLVIKATGIISSDKGTRRNETLEMKRQLSFGNTLALMPLREDLMHQHRARRGKDVVRKTDEKGLCVRQWFHSRIGQLPPHLDRPICGCISTRGFIVVPENLHPSAQVR